MNTTRQSSANDLPADTAGGSGRRKFLNRLWALLGALACIEFGWLTGSILSSKKEKPNTNLKENFITVGEVGNFSPDSVTAVPEGQFYLARLKDGSFLALSHTCTHLGCSLPWDADSHKFICPCHGSTFDIGGEVLTPPAIRGLNSYALRIENGIIRVNIATSQKRLQNGKPRSVQA